MNCAECGLAWPTALSVVMHIRQAHPEDTRRIQIESLTVRGDGCWGWLGVKHSRGYATLAGVRVSRILLGIERNDPRKIEALHRCDNPQCVNPAHLEVGTHAKNMADASKRGLMPVGRANGKFKTPEPVRQRIRELSNAGLSSRAIAAQVGLGKSTVNVVLADL